MTRVFITGWGQGREREPVTGAYPLNDAPLPVIRRADVLDAPDKTFGRMDAFCRLGLAACARTLRRAGVYPAKRELPEPTGMVVGTGYGCLATDLAYFGTCPPLGEGCSPHLFAYTLPNVLLGEAALRFGLRGPAFVLQRDPASAALDAAPVLAALDFLEDGDAEAMLAGICELGLPDTLERGDALPATLRGSLFLLLEKSPPPAYAAATPSVLERSADGGLVVDGAPAPDMRTLYARLSSAP